jgi:cytoskeletal protein RodZ
MFDLSTLFILVLALALAGILLWLWHRDSTETETETPTSIDPDLVKTTPEPVPAAAVPKPKAKRTKSTQSHPAGEVTPTKKVSKPSSRVAALKSPDAVTDTTVPVIAPPTKTQMERMTKESLEIEARKFGIELDRRLTKAGMITAFLTALKANK